MLAPKMELLLKTKTCNNIIWMSSVVRRSVDPATKTIFRQKKKKKKKPDRGNIVSNQQKTL